MSDGTKCEAYGLINGINRHPCYYQTKDGFTQEAKYSVNPGSVAWSIIFMHSVVAPVYFLGFRLFQPEKDYHHHDYPAGKGS